MPLARIITPDREGAAALSAGLERQGYTVEVTKPGEAPLTHPDLEVQLDVFNVQEALARASEIAVQCNAEVVMFPGIANHLRDAALVPETASVPEATASVPSQSPSSRPNLPMPGLPTSEELAEKPGAAMGLHDGAASAAPQETVEEHGRSRAFRSLLTRILLTKIKSVLGLPVRLWAASARAYSERRRAKMESQAIKGREEETWERTAAILEEQRRREIMVVRQVAEIRAFDERRRAEIESREAEARARAAMLAEERRRREMSAERKARQASELQSHRLEAAPGAFPAEPRPPASSVKARRLAPHGLHWRGILVGATASGMLFALGLVLAGFRPRSPLSPAVVQHAVGQETPFGPVASPVAPQVSPGISAPAPVAPSLDQPSRMQAPAVPAAVPRTPSRKPHPRRAFQGEAEITAEDVVVRHFSSPKSPKQNTQAGLKRYSDISR